MLGLENVFSAGSFQEFTSQIIGIVAVTGLLILITKLFSRSNRAAHATKKANKKTARSAAAVVYSNQSKYQKYTASKKYEFMKLQAQQEKQIRKALKTVQKSAGALASKAKKFFRDRATFTKRKTKTYMLEIQETKMDQNMNQASILQEIKPLDRALALLETLKTEDNLQAKLQLQSRTIETLKEISKQFNEVSTNLNATTKAQYNTEKAMQQIVRSVSRALPKEHRAAKKVVEDAHELDPGIDTKLPAPPNARVFAQFARQKPHKSLPDLKLKRRKEFTYYIDNLPKIIELLKQLEQWCSDEIGMNKNFMAMEHEMHVYETYSAALQEKMQRLQKDTQIQAGENVDTEKVPAMIESVTQYDEKILEQAEQHVKSLLAQFEAQVENKIEVLKSLDGSA